MQMNNITTTAVLNEVPYTPKTRHVQILNLLNANPGISVTDLSVRLDVSESTIRRDLSTLENHGWVLRVQGTAILQKTYPNGREWPFEFREVLHSRDKDLIG